MMPTDYTLIDATLEILLMLLAAFLLGWLFCWILKKIFGRKPVVVSDTPDLSMAGDVSTDINKQASQGYERTGLSASSRERLYDPEHGLTKDTVDTAIPTVEATDLSLDDVDLDVDTSRPRIDIPDLNMPTPDIKGSIDSGIDLGKGGITKGIGAAAVGLGGIAASAGALKDKAVASMPDVDIPEVDLPDLDVKGKLDAGIDSAKGSLDSISASASALKDKATGSIPDIDTPDIDLPDLDLEGKLDAGIDSAKDGIDGITASAGELKDKAVSGISDVGLPEIDLPDVDAKGKLDAGIDSAKGGLDDITASAAALKDKVASNIPDVDLPNVDLPDADIKGNLETASDAGKEGLGKGLGVAAAGLGAIAASASTLKTKTTEGVDSISTSAATLKSKVLENDLTPPDLPNTETAKESLSEAVKSHATKSSDDLTRITGIDSKTASVLAGYGIKTFSDLESTDSDTIKSYLKQSSDISISKLEPTSWPHQAKLCASENWDKLAEYQTFLSGTDTSKAPTSAVEEVVSSKDDLKKIEGIGPFFESLLNKAGITTYAQLKDSERDDLKEIIDAAGPDYRLHEPETWPYQAGLADRGEWKKLQDYIHFMTGRS